MQVKKIAVIGAGAMGNGIAQVGIMAGFTVAMHDIEPSYVDRGVQAIESNLTKFIEKGRL